MIQFIMQLINLQIIFVVAKIRFNVFIWFLNFLMIVSIDVKRVKFVSLVICIRLSVILCHFMHLVFSHIEWWMLKSLINKCLSDLLNNCYKLYIKKFLLMFHKDFKDDKYILWMYSIMSFNLRINIENLNFECFII